MFARVTGFLSSVSQEVEREKNLKFRRGVDELGPTRNRSCTDVVWIPFFVGAQVVFLFVTLVGLKDGSPERLYKPRDFRGNYCGVSENWNNGLNTEEFTKSSHMMNTFSVVDEVLKQTICSTYARQVLLEGDRDRFISPLLETEEEQAAYLCDCCLVPCGKCQGKQSSGGDLWNAEMLRDRIGDRMGELTGVHSAGHLFNPAVSANGNMLGGHFWQAANEHFHQVCVPDCDISYSVFHSPWSHRNRNYAFEPALDDPLFHAWRKVVTAPRNQLTTPLKEVIDDFFTFQALPVEVCPYEPEYCVPMPGVQFQEFADSSGYCSFQLTSEVVEAVGHAAAEAFESYGGDSITDDIKYSIGEFVGDFRKTMDSFVIVSILSFVIGIAFLILLRFFLGACVMLSVAVSVMLFAFGGLAAYIHSNQCKGAGLLETGRQAAIAVVVAGAEALDHVVDGEVTQSEALHPEGDGSDYQGAQTHTINGRRCAHWDNQTVFPEYNSRNFDGLVSNYCRNPYRPGDLNKASTIWCITTDPDIWWEECHPIGVVLPECKNGFAVPSARHRSMWKYGSYGVWALGSLWVLLLFCCWHKIQLAIALNKVAAVFLANNPHILLVPMIQAAIAIAWALVWIMSAAFLLSQVPADHTPTGYFATKEEALGTADEPGACSEYWPSGFAWHDSDCELAGNITKCWRCAPPRFVLDWRFFASLLVFLWNNAFNVALGQMLVAMASCVWFFTAADEKGLSSVVPKAVYTVTRYHLGSVMFGSFIVAMVQFVRCIMQYVEKQAAVQKNRVVVFILYALQCVTWCFEKCIQFINKNAYIQISLGGTPFCMSAKKAFFLILRNAVHFGAVAALSWGVHTIGFVSIMSGSLASGYFIVRLMHQEVMPTACLLAIAAVSWVVAKLYMNVFGLAVDTSLQCFLACQEMGEGGDFVPRVLQEFMVDYQWEYPAPGSQLLHPPSAQDGPQQQQPQQQQTQQQQCSSQEDRPGQPPILADHVEAAQVCES